jgi:hypothetical protein
LVLALAGAFFAMECSSMMRALADVAGGEGVDFASRPSGVIRKIGYRKSPPHAVPLGLYA